LLTLTGYQNVVADVCGSSCVVLETRWSCLNRRPAPEVQRTRLSTARPVRQHGARARAQLHVPVSVIVGEAPFDFVGSVMPRPLLHCGAS
jgi:hypothetical protein